MANSHENGAVAPDNESARLNPQAAAYLLDANAALHDAAEYLRCFLNRWSIQFKNATEHLRGFESNSTSWSTALFKVNGGPSTAFPWRSSAGSRTSRRQRFRGTTSPFCRMLERLRQIWRAGRPAGQKGDPALHSAASRRPRGACTAH
jgi:hypothetical protein